MAFAKKSLKAQAATGLSSQEQGTILGTSNGNKPGKGEAGKRHVGIRLFKASVCAWDKKAMCRLRVRHIFRRLEKNLGFHVMLVFRPCASRK